MIVAHNLLASNASRQFNITTKNKAKITEKLSSGYKINRSADDAAGLSISEKMRHQIRGLNQAVSNAQDGISLIQVADGALSTIHSMLHRTTELCVQAANDTNSTEDRESIQQEIDEILKEIDTISDKTKFNNRYLLKGDNVLVVGAANPPIIKGSLPSWASIDAQSAANGYMSGIYSASDGSHVSTIINFSRFTGSAADIAEVANGEMGFYTTCCTCDNHYSICFNDSTTSSLETSGNHYIYNIGIGDATSAADITNKILAATGGQPNGHYTKMFGANWNTDLVIYDERANVTADSDSGLIGAGVAYSATDPDNKLQGDLYLQVGANAGEDMLLSLPAISTSLLRVGATDVSTHASATAALDNLKYAVKYVSDKRSKLGAYQNRLEYTIANLQNYHENLSSAESLIRDSDMAEEMLQYSKANILEQVGQAMISQANQTQQGVLSLLQ